MLRIYGALSLNKNQIDFNSRALNSDFANFSGERFGKIDFLCISDGKIC